MRRFQKVLDSDVSKIRGDITIWSRVRIQVCRKEEQKELMTERVDDYEDPGRKITKYFQSRGLQS